MAYLLEGLARAPSMLWQGYQEPGGGSQPHAKQRVASGQLYARDHRTDKYSRLWMGYKNSSTVPMPHVCGSPASGYLPGAAVATWR